MLDCLIGGLSYWAIGWALAYGPCDCGEGMGFSEDGKIFNIAIYGHKVFIEWSLVCYKASLMTL